MRHEGVNVSGFFNFDRMITPTIIKIIYWILLIFAVLGGLIILIAGHGAGAKFAGLVELVLGPIFVRVYCEILIVVFKIHGTLVQIEKNTTQPNGTQVATEGAEG
jgi:Domain of unknown function (DUF4282)